MSKKLKMPEKGLFGLPSSVRQTNDKEIKSTQVLEDLSTEHPENPNTQELENLSTEESHYSSTQISNDLNTQVSENYDTDNSNDSSTRVPENQSISEPENLSIGQPEDQNASVVKKPGTKDAPLPKSKKNNRIKDEKKPLRKQASVHLTGATLKALHLFAYDEGLEKSEITEKALRKFIPKKYYE